MREDFQKIMERTKKTADFGSSLRQIDHPKTFACWKIIFKNEVCSCSQFLAEAMLWIKEVELVESVDDVKIFVICKRNSTAKFRVIRRENCFSTEQHLPEFSLQDKGESGGTESPKRRPLPPR